MARRARPTNARGNDKDPDAFRNISETADLLGVRNHVLRFWEGRFPQLKPMKRAGNRRLYRPEDLELLFGIRQLLHGDAYTIKGVQKILREDGVEAVKAVGRKLVPLGQPDDGSKGGPVAPADNGTAAKRVRAQTDPAPREARAPADLPGRSGSEGLPMLRDAVEFAIVELEVARAILLGEEEPTPLRRAASGTLPAGRA